MKHLLLWGAVLLAMTSCASLKPLPDSTLTEKAKTYSVGPSKVDPIQLKVVTDYAMDRWTLVRQERTSKSGSSPLPDRPVGLDFGNGIYLDVNNNLSIRFDGYFGVDPAFRGKVEYLFHNVSDEKGTVRVATYSTDQITVVDPSPLLAGRNDTVKAAEKKVTVAGASIEKKDDNHLTVAPSFTLSPFDGQTYETTDNTVKWSWWDLSWGIIPYTDTDTFTINGNTISDSQKTIVVEGHDDYVRVAFTKGNQFSFRLYRTADKIVVLDESTGNPAFIALKKDQTLDWDARLMGPLGITTDKVVHYQYNVVPEAK